MSERLFFALWPDRAVRDALAQLGQELAPGATGRPTHPQDLHLTLVFLGGLEESRRACAEHVATAVREATFALRLDQVGLWSRSGTLWCGPGAVPLGLSRLVARLSEGVSACGIGLEARPYRPHVTLMRKARLDGEPSSARPTQPIDWDATEFVLAGSAGDGPPRYRVLRRWPLAV